jgi:7-carboxy-7-deazaguanine synthase
MTTGYVGEVFSGIQGEGLYVGERQIFVRLLGCNLRCAYCDTTWAREPALYCRVERTPGGRDFEEHANPLNDTDLAAFVGRLNEPSGLHDAVSITGGEPLSQPEFVRDLARQLRQIGLRVHLETNGTLAAALALVIDSVDVVAMDVKLPSAAGLDCWDDHAAFLDAARPLATGDSRLFVKAVVGQPTTEQEIVHACRMIAAVSPRIPLVLQPVTEVNAGPASPSPSAVLQLQAIAKQFLASVRVIPQMHKLMGQL